MPLLAVLIFLLHLPEPSGNWRIGRKVFASAFEIVSVGGCVVPKEGCPDVVVGSLKVRGRDPDVRAVAGRLVGTTAQSSQS